MRSRATKTENLLKTEKLHKTERVRAKVLRKQEWISMDLFGC